MTPERGPRDVRLERLVFLVDGIYAIAMTLLAVELILPESSAELVGDALLHSLWDGRYRVLAYVTSFLFIANFWVGTLMIVRHIRRFDGRMLWIILLHMLLIAFIPYPTSVIGQHPNDQVAQVFYFATLSVTAVFLALFGGTRPDGAGWSTPTSHRRWSSSSIGTRSQRRPCSLSSPDCPL